MDSGTLNWPAAMPMRRRRGQRHQSGGGATVAGDNRRGLALALDTLNKPGKLGLCLEDVDGRHGDVLGWSGWSRGRPYSGQRARPRPRRTSDPLRPLYHVGKRRWLAEAKAAQRCSSGNICRVRSADHSAHRNPEGYRFASRSPRFWPPFVCAADPKADDPGSAPGRTGRAGDGQAHRPLEFSSATRRPRAVTTASEAITRMTERNLRQNILS